jgi:hypothetical protein
MANGKNEENFLADGEYTTWCLNPEEDGVSFFPFAVCLLAFAI